MPQHDLIEILLEAARSGQTLSDLPSWWQMYVRTAQAHASTLDRAIVAGARSDRLGYAFASGYEAALASLFSATRASSMLVTESGGGHPRAIAASLAPAPSGFTLDGEKRFATLAPVAEVLYVLVKEGERGDLPSLRVVAVPRDREGIKVEPMPGTPFCPEIPHAIVRFSNVHVAPDERLAGDGYADFVKPFRTVEDLHVFGGALGLAIGLAVRAGLDAAIIERYLALACTLRSIAALERDAPGTALALDGALVLVRDALTSVPDALRDHDFLGSERWSRDAGIFRVAASARAARTAKARVALGLTR